MSNFDLSHIQHTEKTHTFIQSFKTYYFKARKSLKLLYTYKCKYVMNCKVAKS